MTSAPRPLSVAGRVPRDADASTRSWKEAPAGRSRLRGPSWSALLYIAPAFLLYGLFVIIPALHTVYISLFTWDGVTLATWAGLSNYEAVFTSDALRGAVEHAFVLVLFFAGLPILLGLALTAVLARFRRPGMSLFRVIFFLPQIVPLVAVGITWRWMYTQDGAVNQILRAIGLGGITRAWLGDFDLALFAVGLIGTWALSGLCTMLFVSGAQKVEPNLYEAARLDGAGALREFRAVTLPALRGEIAVALTVTTIAALASFDIIYVSTNGAPGDTTTVPGLLVYRLAFTDGQVGQASALAVTLTVLILIVVLIINRLVSVRDDE
ncbi:carbohydrate ABC transporter membrane protein 1, CUT1 family [Nakamurella panacisegetis]|uniref:Carbohydrate ABC transporter membrane protein 1, CUT1 family n=1 Tax=Nakamurella panacisegetis TaxID=1090615 RepID=A0A1H0QSA1_9ACTN|nr:sugar ABC transporter permease [Nakamurella panacisegetis]SDP20237.1 carbohydrate ABC transporter membrane protein 1, CUT1 family [Nakamurella panacisegetis]